MTKEKQLWEWLRTRINTRLPPNRARRIDRIESLTTPGIPDVSYTILGVDGWIELKAVDLPVRMATRVLGPKDGLSQDQMNWHKRHLDAGGLSFVFVHAGEWRWLIHGCHGDLLNEYSREDWRINCLLGVNGRWDANHWDILMSLLTRGTV